MVEVCLANRAARGRIEEDEVGVATDLDRALLGKAEPPGGRRREEVDHPLDGDAAGGDPKAVHDGQHRLDPRRTVADLVEGHAPRRGALLDGRSEERRVGREWRSRW